jgi:hypothetical protein
VPGMTRSLIPLLRRSNVTTITIGTAHIYQTSLSLTPIPLSYTPMNPQVRMTAQHHRQCRLAPRCSGRITYRANRCTHFSLGRGMVATPRTRP